MIPVYSSWYVVGTISTGVLVVLAGWGHVLLDTFPGLRIAHVAVSRRAEEFFYGVFAFSVVGFFAVLAGSRLDLTFVSGTGLVLVLAIVRRVGERGKGRRSAPSVSPADRRLNWLAPVIVVAGSLLWSTTDIRGLEGSGSSFVLVPWVDFFFHARQISNFARFDGDPGALHWSMYGEALPPYHYASYMVPALVVRLGGLPSLQLATSLYPVLGMLLTGAVMLVLLESRHGAAAALAGVSLLFFLPDTWSSLPAEPQWYSYFFFQQVGVGGAYATAICGMSLACALHAPACGSLKHTISAAGLLICVGFFKVQILLAYGVFFFLYILWLAPRLDRRLKAVAVVLAVGIFLLVVWKVHTIPNAPTLGLSLESIRKYFPWSTLLVIGLLPLAALAVWAVTYGLLLPAIVLLARKLRHDTQARQTIYLVAGVLLAHAFVRLLIEDNHGLGDPFEINRKTFVLPYFVVVYATAALGGRWMRQSDASVVFKSTARARWWAVAVALLAVSASALAAYRLQVWPGSAEFVRVVVPGGLVGAASYLKLMSGRNDVVQLCENDVYNELGTLAERSIYVSKVMINPSAMSPQERRRFDALAELNRQPDFASASRQARDLKIAWWVESPACQTRWAAARSPSFASAGYRVYRLDNPPPLRTQGSP